MKSSRRNFIKTTSAVSAGVIVNPALFARQQKIQAPKYPICVFSKCLQFLDYPQLGEALVKIGFNSAELSVRNKGHVLPENVATDLPKAIKILQQSGITVPMMVTGINNPDDPLTERVLGTASEQGVGYYRMGYLWRISIPIRKYLKNLKSSTESSVFKAVIKIMPEQVLVDPYGIFIGF